MEEESPFVGWVSDVTPENRMSTLAASPSSPPLIARTTAGLRLLGLCAGALIALAACERADARVSKETGTEAVVGEGQGAASRGATPGDPSAPAEAEAVAGQATYREEAFELAIAPPAEAKAGEAAEAIVTLQAKPPYKVNEEYPIKLKLGSSAGLTFPTPVVGKDKATVEVQKAVMKVPFTASAAGEHTLGGTFSFSVCTDERCLIEKRELAVQIAVR